MELEQKEIKKNKILVDVSSGGKYVCHARAIVDMLLSLEKDFEIVWLTKCPEEFPKKIRAVRNTQKNLLIELSDTKIFICNDIYHFGVPKKKNQIFINTWHGSVALKRVGKYIKYEFKKQLADMDLNNSASKTDYFISNGSWCSNMYRDSFRYEGEILEYGSPRIDTLFEDRPDRIVKTKHELGIDVSDNIMLYAPTFREGVFKDKTGVMCFDAERIKQVLHKKWGGRWNIILKLHPCLENNKEIEAKMRDCIIVDSKRDIYELMRAADLLVTDYSSTMFEAGYLEKKVLLLADDVQDYIDNERGMYFDYYSLPYKNADSEDKLIENILEFDEGKYVKNVQSFNQNVLGIVEDGNATKRVVKLIEDIMEGE